MSSLPTAQPTPKDFSNVTMEKKCLNGDDGSTVPSSSPPPPCDSSSWSPFPDQLRFLSSICGSLKRIKRTGWVRSGVPLPESDSDHMHRCAMAAMLVMQPPHPDDINLYNLGKGHCGAGGGDSGDGGNDDDNDDDDNNDNGGVEKGKDGHGHGHGHCHGHDHDKDQNSRRAQDRIAPYARFDPRQPGNVDAMKLLRMALTHDLCESLAGDVTPHCPAHLVNSKHVKEDEAMSAIRRIVGDPLGMELHGLWKEYEEQKTTEAIYCKDIDKFEMVCQAYEYERHHLIHHPQRRALREDTTSSSEPGAKQEEHEKGTEAKAKGTIESGACAKTEPLMVDSVNNDNDDSAKRVPATDGALSSPLRTFFVSTSSSMRTPLFRRLDKQVREQREAMLKWRGWHVTAEERQRYD